MDRVFKSFTHNFVVNHSSMAAQQSIAIIGSGFSSLASACYLAKQGYKVDVFEKQATTGGRARQLIKEGFTFDIGPTFYWMPDVFEAFFQDFGKHSSDFYDLERLNPSYKVYFGLNDSISVSADFNEICEQFEEIEQGSAERLKRFMANAKENYEIAIKDLVYKPGESLLEIVTPKTATKLNQFIGTIKGQVAKTVKNEKLRKILEFPVLFLGAKPENTPQFYNFMNYADFILGTWQPNGGMYSVVKAMTELATSLGVEFHLSHSVEKILTKDKKAIGIQTNGTEHMYDIVLSGADYHHTETLLQPTERQYSESYWGKKTFAPSALLFYVAFHQPIENVEHHTLFFDTDFNAHAKEIYDTKKWPKNPLFYASFPSKTGEGYAPKGKEAGIFLIPLAVGLEDSKEIRETYFHQIIERIEQITNQNVKDKVEWKESFCVADFINEYNAFGGNAYGLANTLFQTHILRPRLKSKKVKNLFFTGQLTVPGPGVPPSIISGKIVSELIHKYHPL